MHKHVVFEFGHLRVKAVAMALLVLLSTGSLALAEGQDPRWSKLARKAAEHVEAEEYNKALSIQRDMLKYAMSVHGSKSWFAGTSLLQIGTVYYKIGKSADGDKMLAKAAAVFGSLKGAASEKGLTEVAAFYESQGRLTKAKPIYGLLISSVERSAGTDAESLAAALTKAAEQHAQSQRPFGAVMFYRKVVEVQEKQLGPEHRKVAFSLYQLGKHSRKAGQIKKALLYLNRALEIYKNGPEPVPELADIVNYDLADAVREFRIRKAAKEAARRVAAGKSAIPSSEGDVLICADGSNVVPQQNKTTREGLMLHKIQSGDTFCGIAKAYNMEKRRFLEINGLSEYSPFLPGQTVVVERK